MIKRGHMILQFPIRTAKCVCKRRYSVQDNGEKGYCSYHCGAKDQPKHTAKALRDTTQVTA